LGLETPHGITHCLNSYETHIQPISESDIAGQLLIAAQGQNSLTTEEKKELMLKFLHSDFLPAHME